MTKLTEVNSNEALFRQEALDHQRDQVWGSVIIHTPWSFSLLTGLFAAVVVSVALFLAWGEYARKQTVRGYITPKEGLVKLFAEQSGQFTQVFVKEQQLVRKGDPLVTIVRQRANGLDDDIYQSRLREIDLQISNVEENITNAKRNVELERVQRNNQIQQLDSDIISLQKQLKTQFSRVALAKKRYERVSQLGDKQMIARIAVEDSFDGYLQQTEVAQQLEQSLMARENTLQQQMAQLERDELDAKEAHNALVAQLSSLRERRIQISGDRAVTLTAPATGRVTGIQAREGETVVSRVPVLTIVPEEQQYDAYLFLPTRVVGFIEPAQAVRFKFDAFPYQKFGLYDGQIDEISKTIFTPAELDVPIQVNGPVYRVIASLEQQEIESLGKRFQLQSGMTLTADIIYDHRSLFEWLLEPLYSLKS